MARTFRRKDRMSAMTEINVTPLLDLAFALLIIFMISTPLLEQNIDLELPVESPKQQPTNRPERFETISVDANGTFYLGSEALTKEQLNVRLADLAKTADHPVFNVRADKDIPYQYVVTVFDLLKSNNLTKISLDTQAK